MSKTSASIIFAAVRRFWKRRKRSQTTLAVLAMSLTVFGTAVLIRSTNTIYPIGNWLVWRYLELWLWLALFTVACGCLGQLVLVRLFRATDMPSLESAVMSMTIGVVAFVMMMYLGGALGLYGPWFAVALPVMFLALGRKSGLLFLRKAWSDVQSVRLSVVSLAVAIFGLGCVGVTYFRILTPDALGYDAVWFYVKIAQDYARWGRIRSFPGDYSHALPQLASLLYCWGYLLPGLHVALRWVFALHMEMCLFLWTLAGIAATVARLVSGSTEWLHSDAKAQAPEIRAHTPRSTWVVFFLFPGFFVYGLWGTGEHITAFFTMGVVLAVLRACLAPGAGTFAALAVPIAGGLLTKYQAIYVILPALTVAACTWIAALVCGRNRPDYFTVRRDLLRVPLSFLGISAVLLAPHFLQNLIFYHNPVYPFQQRLFTGSYPTVPHGWLYFDYGMKPSDFVPSGTLLAKLSNAVNVILTPSQLPRSGVAAACSIFVLLLPAIVLVRRNRPMMIVSVIGAGALLLWATILADVRHLETITPVLAAASGGFIVYLWRLGKITRLGLIPLVLIQLIWSADSAFCDSSRAGIDSSLRLIHSGLEGRGAAIFDEYRSEYRALGRAVPADSKLVIHTFGVSLGIDRDIVMDSIGFQGLISYQSIHTPRELYDRFKELGITHLVHEPNGPYGSPTKQEDIVFHALAAQYGVPIGRFGGLFLTAMPPSAPPSEPPYRVLCLGLDGLVNGLYPIEELRNWSRLPPRRQVSGVPEQLATPSNESTLLEVADAVLCPPDGCRLVNPSLQVLARRFVSIDNRIRTWALFLKRTTSTQRAN